MDRSLFYAAWTGNVESLHKLVEDDPCMLCGVTLASRESPLHVACLAGHLHFVQEIMKLSREFAGELNQDGFSPLHIASAKGHAEIVKELLKVDHNLCLIKGRERKLPLHHAAISGRVEVMGVLLSANANSIEEVTARGETALHLAVKNNQFEALIVLLEHLKQFSKEGVINKKDDQGNSILHLAASRKQYEVVELVLSEGVEAGAIEVNLMNERGFTPLDLLLLFQSEAGDREIEDLLRVAGARRAAEVLPSLAPATDSNNQLVTADSPLNEQSRTGQSLSPSKQLAELFKYDEVRDTPAKVRNSLLVIAILIVTATYQAALSPPGGVWQDDSIIKTNGTKRIVLHVAGRAVMGTNNWVCYGLFLFFNSIGFYTSLQMILALTSRFPLRLELGLSAVALATTYGVCMGAISPGYLNVFFSVLSGVMPQSLPILCKLARNHLKRPRDWLPCTRLSTA